MENIENKETETGLLDEIKSSLRDEIKADIKAELKAEFAKPRVYAQAKGNDWHEGEWFKAAIDAGRTDPRDSQKREKAINLLTNKYGQFEYQAKAMTQSTTTAGGFLVPDIWSPDLQGLTAMSPIVQLFKPIPMTSDVLKIPVKDQTGTPSGNSAFFAGYKFVVVTEGNTQTETKPAFKQVSLTAKKFMAYTEISNELIDNSMVSVQALITQDGYGAALNELSYQILNGTDLTATLGNASVIKVPRTTTLRANRIEDFAKIKQRVLNAKFWVIGPYVEAELLSMVNAGNYPTYMITGASSAGPGTIFGLPYYVSEAAPALGSEGDVILVDPSGYALGINQQITVSTSDHYVFGKDAQAIRVTFRAAGAPLLTAPVLLRSDTTKSVSWCAVLDDLTS